MRAIAAVVSDKGDAAEIVRYANWLVRPRSGGSRDKRRALGSWSAGSAEAPVDEI